MPREENSPPGFVATTLTGCLLALFMPFVLCAGCLTGAFKSDAPPGEARDAAPTTTVTSRADSAAPAVAAGFTEPTRRASVPPASPGTPPPARRQPPVTGGGALGGGSAAGLGDFTRKR